MNFLKIKETCLYVDDLQQAKAFYHGILQLPIVNYQEGKHLFLKAGSSMLLLFNPADSREKISPPGHFGGGKQHFAFEIDKKDYEACKTWIQSKGVQIIDEVQWKASLSFYFNDPEGNVLEVVPNTGVWD